MPEISFTQEDIVSTAELSAGWYPLAAKSIMEGPGKKDPSSTTWTCEFEVIDGPSKGAKVTTWFSSKMMKNAIRYLRAHGVVPEAGKTYPLEATVDRPIMGYIVYDLENQSNVIKDFKPVWR